MFLLMGAGLLWGGIVFIQGGLEIDDDDMNDEPKPVRAKLVITDKLADEEKELVIETDEWKVVMGLLYNGGVYKIFDKVNDPAQQDNLVTGPGYSQGGIFDYDVYLFGDQELSTTIGRNNEPGRATLQIIENTPVPVIRNDRVEPTIKVGLFKHR